MALSVTVVLASSEGRFLDLQHSADIVISGTAEKRNDQGNKSGWNGTCYMLAEQWMDEHGITASQLSPTDAKAQVFAWLQPRWDEQAVAYLHKKLARCPSPYEPTGSFVVQDR